MALKFLTWGVDVRADKFIEAAKEFHADIICMSALLTTTMLYMENVIRAVEMERLKDHVKIMVGGAPVNEDFALKIGADAYSSNANQAVQVARRLLGK